MGVPMCGLERSYLLCLLRSERPSCREVTRVGSLRESGGSDVRASQSWPAAGAHGGADLSSLVRRPETGNVTAWTFTDPERGHQDSRPADPPPAERTLLPRARVPAARSPGGISGCLAARSASPRCERGDEAIRSTRLRSRQGIGRPRAPAGRGRGPGAPERVVPAWTRTR